ncbi:MAG: fumarylacetoacetate hydrolase family protein [Caldilineaceae bacterium]|nr:fumarylacetoacetate hydrolase family protein [Caldilineaceae bacterium]
MMDREKIQRAAGLLADAWLADNTIDLPSRLLPTDRASAYATQDEMARLLAADPANSPAGWKVGATSPGVQSSEGYDGPIPGRILASTIYASGAAVPLTRCRHAKVEAEVAFRFTAAPPRTNGEVTRDDLEAIVTAAPALDITGTRYAPSCRSAWNGRQNMLAGIADNGNGGAIVLGEETSSWRNLDFMQLQVDLSINGDEAAPNLWDRSRGNPIEALVWTVNQVHARGFALAAGHVVLTGSLTEPQPIHEGDSVTCQMPGLGSLSCHFSRA